LDSDEKYLDIRDKLKNLVQVKASDDFVHKLHHKIVALQAEKKKQHIKKYDESKGGFLRNLFSNRQYPWLIPAAGFTVLIFFVFYMTYLSKNTPETDTQNLSTQKSEQTVQQNSPPTTTKNEPPQKKELTLTPGPTTSESKKGNSPENNIKDNLKMEEDNKPLAQIENEKKQTDNDNLRRYINEEKTLVQNESGQKMETYNKDEMSKQSSEQGNIEKKGVVETGPAPKVNSSIKSDSERTSTSVANEEESQSKKLLDKLNIINRTNLENLRDKISNN
jgi:hypothetical protein